MYGQVGWDNNPSDLGDWRGVDPIRNSSWRGTHVAGIIGAQVNTPRTTRANIQATMTISDYLPD
jgi:hypothetical protein